MAIITEAKSLYRTKLVLNVTLDWFLITVFYNRIWREVCLLLKYLLNSILDSVKINSIIITNNESKL